MAIFNNPRQTAGTATTSAPLARGFHTPVDATSGAKTMTLPTNAPIGGEISVEKVDTSANAVTVSGTIRGTTGSIALTAQYDARTFLSEGNGSWRPISDHRTKSALDATYARSMGWVIATDPAYGAVGDWTGGTSGTDNTAALQAALNAANTRGTVCFIPAGITGGYRFTSLTLPQHTSLQGAGYTSLLQGVPFGSAQWTNTADRSKCRGTVLYSTAASGNAIKGDDPVAARWQISDFLLIGPGTGTATGISLAETGSFNIRPNVSNIMVANFSRGWKIGTTNEGQFDSMVAYGCDTGFDFGTFFNANVVTNIEVQFSTVEAIRISGACNEFVGGIIQNASGVAGLHILPAAPNNRFTQFYNEKVTATDSHLYESEVTFSGHFASNGGNIRVTVGGCLFDHVYAPSSTLTLGPTSVKTVLLRSVFSNIVPNGGQVADIGSFSAGLKSHLVEVGDPGTPGWAFQTSVGGKSRLTDLANSRDQLVYYPGATHAAALSQFGSVIGLASSTTANRPNAGNFLPGGMWYDTTIGRPIWTDGTKWRDAIDDHTFTPEMFGAKGDYDPNANTGTDDTAAWQSAINACLALGARLDAPAKNYRITDTLNIIDGKGFEFSGSKGGLQGGLTALSGTWLHYTGATTKPMLRVEGTSNFTLDGINFHGRNVADGIRIVSDNTPSVTNHTYRNSFLFRVQTGVYINDGAGVTQSDQMLFEDVRMAEVVNTCFRTNSVNVTGVKWLRCTTGLASSADNTVHYQFDRGAMLSLDSCFGALGQDFVRVGGPLVSGVTVDNCQSEGTTNPSPAFLRVGVTTDAGFQDTTTMRNCIPDGPVILAGPTRTLYSVGNLWHAGTSVSVTGNDATFISDAETSITNAAVTLNMTGINARLLRRHSLYSNGVPTSGKHFAGEIVQEYDPVGHGASSWVCTVTGTPGTFEAVPTKAALDARYATVGSTYGSPDALTGPGEMVLARERMTTVGVVVASGTLTLSYFTAALSETITALTVGVGTAAGATPTLCRMGIYTVDASGNLTLVASTANDTALFAAPNAPQIKGLSSPYSKVAGQRYAVGMLVISAATMPTFQGNQWPATGWSNTLARMTPALTGRVLTQTDLPASVPVGSLVGYQAQLGFLLS